MASKAVDEAKDRVGSAIKNSGYTSPKSKNEKLVVSLAPAELKKDGAYYDLAIALGYLLSAEEINFDPSDKLFVGELSLDGSVKPLLGILPIVQQARNSGFKEIFIPYKNRKEAALVSGINIYPVKNLKQIIEHIDTNKEKNNYISIQLLTKTSQERIMYRTDFSDIKGQSIAKRGLEIAAAGGHNVCMFGPPGTGKTMLARAFNSILPDLDIEHALEVMGIHSVSGLARDSAHLADPPLRTPHHTASYVSIVGGGTYMKPGEVTLAHRGILFLDEFPEFDKKVLESLRQPLEDKTVTISRAKGTVTYPANFILIAAMNPCPCGFYGSEHGKCICGAHDISRYQKKISGPIIDRIDIWLPVEHIKYEKLLGNDNKTEGSKIIVQRVFNARKKQIKRFKNNRLNASMNSREIQLELLEPNVVEILNKSAEKMKLSPRAYHRVIKLARTIADLDSQDHIQTCHVLEALQYRPQLFN